jgi:hypothetical protein
VRSALTLIAPDGSYEALDRADLAMESSELVIGTEYTAEVIARRIRKLARPLKTDIDRRGPLKPWAKVRP